MSKKLTGKVALITGGSRGIGAAIARSLADDGADIAISYVSASDKAKALVRELQEKGVRAVAFQTDQSKPAEVAGLVRKVVDHFGHLDILVNNAGVFITGPLGEVSADDVDKQFAINVGGVNARCAKPRSG
jgi:3-oxoacyl-[acyl-carrier protein] reductase